MERLWARLRAAVSAPMLAAILLAFVLVLLARADGGDDVHCLEKRMGKALSQMDGAGRVEVVIRMQHMEERGAGTALYAKGDAQRVPCGAIAVAEGAHDPMVCMKLTQALCSILGLQAVQVEVLPAMGGR